jgi:ABC-type lipoprotein export system ATPase subunit
MLRIENLNLPGILNSINLHVENGIICGIFGSSGSGKTTLLRCIKNLNNEWTGSILYKDHSIKKYDKSIGYVFQETVLFSHMSVLENLQLTGVKDSYIKKQLDYIQIGHLINKRPSDLSGGEKQRVGICRTLLTKPKMILMDEPTSALDTQNKKIIFDLLKKLNKDFSTTIIVVIHDMESKYLFHKIVHMENGKISSEE